MSSDTHNEDSAIGRIADAQREVGLIADALFFAKTSTKAERLELARRLNAARSSLLTAELNLRDRLALPPKGAA